MATLIRYKATGHTRLIADFAACRLIAAGIATAVKEESAEKPVVAPPVIEPTAPVEYQTRALEAGTPEKPAREAAEADQPKRTYKRRDTKSKD